MTNDQILTLIINLSNNSNPMSHFKPFKHKNKKSLKLSDSIYFDSQEKKQSSKLSNSKLYLFKSKYQADMMMCE